MGVNMVQNVAFFPSRLDISGIWMVKKNVVCEWKKLDCLYSGFNPSEKYVRQIGSFLQVGVRITNIWNHHLVP